MINFVLLTVLCWSAWALPQQPDNPVIGIVVMPMNSGGCDAVDQPARRAHNKGGNATGCVWGYYVKWLESSGIRVIPLPWDANATTLDYLLQRVNGVLLTGGSLGAGVPGFNEYYATVTYIYKSVVEMNARGDNVVMWGTCEGFQFICSIAAGTLAVIEGGFKGLYPRMLPVNFTTAAPSSQMFGTAPEGVLDAMAHKNTTLNWHHFGIVPSAFAAGGLLANSSIIPLATSNDVTGRTFVAALEHRTAAVFAVQFHPERPAFEFSDDAIGHDVPSVVVSDYLGLFLVNKLRGNKHTFGDPAVVDKMSIENYPSANYGYGRTIYLV